MIAPIILDYRKHISTNNKNDSHDNITLKTVFETIPEKEWKGVSILADGYRLMQVISNLLNNAIKFTRSGIITVGIKMKSNSQVIVYVKDNGKGIDSEIFPSLFTKFASKSDKGTGLGLFISKNIIEAHGGKIWAENNKDGKGATFAFNLPLAKG